VPRLCSDVRDHFVDAMGRQHLKLPEHLYLSPPQTPSSSYSYLSLTSTYSSSAALFQEIPSNALAVSDRIPGFKTSAGKHISCARDYVPVTKMTTTAFLNSLRANITLADDSAPTSLTNTPDSLRPINMASSTGSLPPPSPLANPPDNTYGSPKTSPLADVPELLTKPATTDDDKIDSLKLLADSVAQMRQQASKAMIFHPLTVGILLPLIAIAGQWQYDGTSASLALVGVTAAGLFMAVLITVRWAVSGYIELAEQVGTWKWLEGVKEGEGDKVEDVVLLEKYGEEAVGTVVIRGLRDDSASLRKNGRRQGSGGGKGNVRAVIRGWSVKRRYRRKGLGTGLLEEAVKVCQEKGWTGPSFADEHANSGRTLWTLFNGAMESREKKARALLEKVIKEQGGSEKEGRRAKR
jgi:GNAT superfamily N-acetyltransferase